MTVSLGTSLLLALTLGHPHSASTLSAGRKAAGTAPDSAALTWLLFLLRKKRNFPVFSDACVNFYSRTMRRHFEAALGAGRKLRLGRRSFRAVLQLSRHGLPPRHGRRGIHSRLLHAPGSSLVESTGILLHIEEILKSTPEVENTFPPHRPEWGWLPSTEATTGIQVRLERSQARHRRHHCRHSLRD